LLRETSGVENSALRSKGARVLNRAVPMTPSTEFHRFGIEADRCEQGYELSGSLNGDKFSIISATFRFTRSTLLQWISEVIINPHRLCQCKCKVL